MKDTSFGGCSWIYFGNRVDGNCTTVCFVTGADYRVTAVFCIVCRVCDKVEVELLSLAAEGGCAGYAEGLHDAADL